MPPPRAEFTAHLRRWRCYAAGMGRVHNLLAALLSLAAASLPAPGRAQTFPERGRDAVVDAANVIPAREEAALARRLTAWERETGHQLVVATVPDLEGRPIADYAVGLFRHWRLGRAGIDDGILLLHAPNEERVRIEVGYGLEASLPDALANRILRETITPDLRRDPGAALTAGAERIIAELGESAAAAEPAGTAPARFVDRPHPDDEGPSGLSVLLWSLGILALIVAVIVWLVRRGNRAKAGAGAIASGSGTASGHQATDTDLASATWASASTYSSHSESWSSSSDSSSSSSDSGGFDSGGGSSGGGGSDSSY